MISIQGLTKFYGATCALDNISFEVNKGEILGLLGPNGAGKTTTLKILTCYMLPSAGNIMVKDCNIFNDSLKIKQMIGYLPESAPLYKYMIVYDYLQYIANIRGIEKTAQKKRIHELAEICGINEVMHKNIDALSKGYKQRVGLAHAMMSDPEILVLDEPTSGLDPNQIIDVRQIIKEIGKTKTIIISSHILSEIEATCDRVVIINKGTIVADDSTEKLRKSSGDQYTLKLSLKNADPGEVRSKLQTISGVGSVEPDHSQKNEFTNILVNCSASEDIREEIYKTVKASDWILMEYGREIKSLENIFRQLTREN